MNTPAKQKPVEKGAGKTYEEVFPEDRPSSIVSRPFLLFLITITLVFWVEVVVMIIISLFPGLTIITEAFIDAFLLTLIAYPIFYFLFLKPIRLHISRRNQSEEELQRYREDLEELVKKRTSELTDANDRLKNEIFKRQEMEDELKDKMAEFETVYHLSVGRELKMKELKDEIEALRSELARDKRTGIR